MRGNAKKRGKAVDWGVEAAFVRKFIGEGGETVRSILKILSAGEKRKVHVVQSSVALRNGA